MIPVVIYPYNLQPDYIGLSTDEKPDKANKGAIYFERDTELTYSWNGKEWVEETRGLISRGYHWDKFNWDWVASSIGNDGLGQLVSVENFPAVISGVNVPVTNANLEAIAKAVGNYYLLLDDYTTPSVTYVGKAVIGSLLSAAVWQIKKIDETTGLAITWADSNDNFDNIWNNRTTITYG